MADPPRQARPLLKGLAGLAPPGPEASRRRPKLISDVASRGLMGLLVSDEVNGILTSSSADPGFRLLVLAGPCKQRASQPSQHASAVTPVRPHARSCFVCTVPKCRVRPIMRMDAAAYRPRSRPRSPRQTQTPDASLAERPERVVLTSSWMPRRARCARSLGYAGYTCPARTRAERQEILRGLSLPIPSWDSPVLSCRVTIALNSRPRTHTAHHAARPE